MFFEPMPTTTTPSGLIGGLDTCHLQLTKGGGQYWTSPPRKPHSQSVRRIGGTPNPLLWGAVGLSLALQVAVVYVPFLNRAFDTTPIGPADWLVCAVMGSTVLWADELRKLVRSGGKEHR